MPALGTILSTADVPASTIPTVTPGATPALTAPSGRSIIIWAWTAGEAETLNLTGTPALGATAYMIITNDAIARLITFGTGFTAQAGTLLGTSNKKSIIVWISDGTTFIEVSRLSGL